MRSRVAALLALVLMLPSAQAQLLTDPLGDVEARPLGLAGAPASWDRADLTALDIEETPSALRFTVSVAALTEGEPTPDSALVLIHMRHGDAWYMLHFTQSEDNGAPFAYLHRSSGPSGWGPVIASPRAVLDASAGTFTAEIDRSHFVDGDGTPPEKGHALEDLRVGAYASATYSTLYTPVTEGGANIGDEMPDAGGDPARWDFQYGGGEAQGPVGLGVDPPFRASNGEATTYRLMVTVENLDDADATYRLTTPGLPSNWQVHVAGDQLKVAAGGQATFPVHVTTPFSHQHSAVVAFDVRVERADDPGVFASREVGVHYHTVPQPAGHHDTLHLHSAAWSDIAETVNPMLGGTDGQLSMNAMAEDPGDALEPIRGTSWLAAGEQHFAWTACLAPELAMGLDFDLARDGALDAVFASTVPMSAASLQGELLWLGSGEEMRFCSPSSFGEREQVVLGALAPQTVEIGPAGEAVVQAVFEPAAVADRVEHTVGANLVLRVEMVVPVPALGGTGGVDLMPGATLRLPLLEYHDEPDFVMPENGSMAHDPEGVFVPAQEEGKDAPGLPGVLLVVAFAVLALRRRR